MGKVINMVGGGAGGGTVTVTDTQDAAGGTVRTITTDPAVTIVEALTATASGTYTAQSGHAFNPVTVDIGGRTSVAMDGTASISFTNVPEGFKQFACLISTAATPVASNDMIIGGFRWGTSLIRLLKLIVATGDVEIVNGRWSYTSGTLTITTDGTPFAASGNLLLDYR